MSELSPNSRFEFLNFGFAHNVPRLLKSDPPMKERLGAAVLQAIRDDAQSTHIDGRRLRMLGLL